jgi:hypothetical protein
VRGVNRAFIPLLGFLFGAPLPTSAAPDEPQSSLRLLQIIDGLELPQPVANGGSLPRSAEVVFEVRAEQGADYLYLLERRSDGVHVLLPESGLVWMRPKTTSLATPRAPEATATEALARSWNADRTGELEFLLVAATAPRDVPSDSRVPSVEQFLLPPPFVRGAAATPATVLATARISWLERDPD